MKKKYANEIEKIFKEKYNHMFYVVNYPKNNGDGRYLWIYRLADSEMVMVIHGGEVESFEIKLIKIDEDETVNKQFDSLEDMVSYIKKDLLDDMMVYGI